MALIDIEENTNYQISYDMSKLLEDYSLGIFNACVHIFYYSFDNYFFGYGIKKLLDKNYRKFDKCLRAKKIRYK